MAIPLLSRRPDSGLGNIRASPARPSRNIDWTLMFAVTALATAGAFAIYSVTWFRTGDPYWYTMRQVIWLILAALVLTVVMSLDYHWLKERAMFFYGCTLLVLGLTLFAGAALSDGSRLGFDLGPFRVQPAEFAKVTVLLALAAYLSEERGEQVSYPRFLGGLLLVGAPVGLILLQPDLGSASVLVVCAMGVLLVAGAKPKYIMLITGLGLVSAAAAVFSGVVEERQIERIEAFVRQNSEDPRFKDIVDQLKYAKRAIATGGVWGKGWLEGPLTNGRYVPVQQSDFIYSGIAEQFGLLGGGVLIGLYGLLLLRIWRIAHLSKDMLGTYICAGVFAMLAWHIFENIGMNLGIMPITGVPLPFISYGGSSVLSFAAMIGLVQSVHMRRMR
jgi:rod shape determining protein RodA